MSNKEETNLQRRIQVELSGLHTRLFRNHRGAAWQGSNFQVRNGRVISGNARFVTFGLAPGASDFVGMHRIVITADMVGKSLSVPVMLETKTEDQRTTKEQKSFLSMAHDMGCISGVATSIDEAKNIISDWTPKLWLPQ